LKGTATFTGPAAVQTFQPGPAGVSDTGRWAQGDAGQRAAGARAWADGLEVDANSKQANQQYRYHIDWNTPISSTTG
jgi:hypothetical protein